MLPNNGNKMTCKVLSAVLLALAGVPAPALAERVVKLSCDNGGKVVVRELYPESTHRYALGDLVEVRLWGERFNGKPYRVGAAPTASYGGVWVYVGNEDDSFSLLKSGRSQFWWVDRGGDGKWTCVETN